MEQPIKNFLTNLKEAAADVQLSLVNNAAQNASLFTLRVWYKDGNARTFHQWKQEIPNPGNSVEELMQARIDHQYAFERAEKFLREGIDKIGRRHFYHARTAIIYENINDSEVLRFVYQKQLYRATLHFGTSKDGHRYLSAIQHFNKRGEPIPVIKIPMEQIREHRKINLEYNLKKFLEENAKP